MKRLLPFVILFESLCLLSCKDTSYLHYLKYNDKTRWFEYQRDSSVVILRGDSTKLVDSSNIAHFLIDSARNKFALPYRSITEDNVTIKNMDLVLAQRYASVIQNIKASNYRASIRTADSILTSYSRSSLFTDCNFLKGYAYEKLGVLDSARQAYTLFYMYSEKKYSNKFHAYRDADTLQIHSIERDYVFHYLNNTPVAFNEGLLQAIRPKYYYTSYSPGFTMNPEDLPKGIKFNVWLFRSFQPSQSGLLLAYRYNDFFTTQIGLAASAYGFSSVLSTPLQIYKSPTNRFGVKFTPHIYYLYENGYINNRAFVLTQTKMLNIGAKISAGFNITQKISVGAFLQYFYYNENNLFVNKKASLAYWNYNEIDVSAYYLIWRQCSAKIGVRNRDLLVGLVWHCIELSFNATNPGLVVRTDLY